MRAGSCPSGPAGSRRGFCPSLCPPRTPQVPLDEPGMRAGADPARIGGDEPRWPCCPRSRKLSVLPGKAEGKELFVGHIWNIWSRVRAAPSEPQLPEHPQARCGHFLPTLPSCQCREEILAGDLTMICRVPEERIRLSLRWRGRKRLLLPFPSLPAGGAGLVWHGRGGSAALNTSSSSSPPWLWESTGMITQTLQGGFGSSGEITVPGISTCTFCRLSFAVQGLRGEALFKEFRLASAVSSSLSFLPARISQNIPSEMPQTQAQTPQFQMFANKLQVRSLFPRSRGWERAFPSSGARSGRSSTPSLEPGKGTIPLDSVCSPRQRDERE